MRTFQNTVTIAWPGGEVCAFLADLANIPRWNYAIARTVPASPGPAGAGTTYRQRRTIPRRSEESLQITAVQPPARLAVQGQPGPYRATAGYLLEPVPGGTRLVNDVGLEPISALLRPIGPLAVPTVKGAAARNLGTLKQRLESTRPAAQVSPQRPGVSRSGICQRRGLARRGRPVLARVAEGGILGFVPVPLSWMHAFIDVPAGCAERVRVFWSAVTGWPAGGGWAGHPEFCSLLPPGGSRYLHLQTIGGVPRVHLDLGAH